MDRCKLEYMIKRFDFQEKKKIIREIDPYGNYMFNKDISRYLVNPSTDDIDILMNVGPCSLIYYIGFVDDDSEIAYSYKKDMEKEVMEVKEKFIAQYNLINELCIENNTLPFFKNPTNISECEKIRLDIVKILPEETLNNFFGVESIRDYEPPVYNRDK